LDVSYTLKESTSTFFELNLVVESDQLVKVQREMKRPENKIDLFVLNEK